jgi:MarR family transcriptional regulator, organic hydroperoxide resistance regulator
MVEVEDSLFLQRWRSVLAPYGLGYRIKLLAQLVYRKLQEALETHGLTPFHWVVLCCLWEEDGLATSVICEKLNQVGGTLTGVLDRMEERHLVRRERDSQDRRVWRIWLTEEGLALQEVLPPLVLQIRKELSKGISPREYELFSQLLDQMISNLTQPLGLFPLGDPHIDSPCLDS